MRPSLIVAVALLVAAASASACRGRAPAEQTEATIAQLVDSLRPAVESAVGVTFRETPRSAMRSRDEVRRYLVAKLDEELPPDRARRLEAAYRLFGLLPDTVALRPLLLDLLTEQVVGFYDPDSATLFGVAGGDPSQLRLVLAHEMVHALQGQYVPLDSVLRPGTGNDRLSAAQAVFEGQATLASMRIVAANAPQIGTPQFWEAYREQVRNAQSSMPRFAAAPLVVREGLVFPYVQGAQFVHWWEQSRFRDSAPWGGRMPVSTEQVLHPERYALGDQPVPLRFADSSSAVLLEDGLGELEIRILQAVATGASELGDAVAIGWGGDRYQVVETPEGPAVVWYAVWDTPQAAERFARSTGRWLARRARPGYASSFDTLEVDGRPATRWRFGPAAWDAAPMVTTGAVETATPSD